MTQCARCAVAPPPISEVGTLCIAPPLSHTAKSLRGLLERLDLPFAEPSPNLLRIPLADVDLGELAEGLGDALSRAELRDTNSLVVADGMDPSLADLAAMRPLSTLVARIRAGWFTAMLREERLTSHFQPIVRADAPEVAFAYECLLRGVADDGSLVPPGRMYEAARDADLLFPLDRAARLSAIRCAASHGLDVGETRLFINFNPTSIYDPNFCLRTTVAAISETAFRPDRVVFEVVESDHVDDFDHLARIADFYREAGFKIALDDLGAGYGSLNLLTRLKPDFVKLDMHLIRGVDRDRYKAGLVRKLLEMARDLEIESVAEGIETEAEWSWVRDHGVDYVQGYLFARPACPPPPSRFPLVEAAINGPGPARSPLWT